MDENPDPDPDPGPDDAGHVTLSRMQLRDGGWVGYGEDALYVQQADGTKIKVPDDSVSRIALQTVEWDLAVMSLLLVGVGTFVAATRNVFVGVAFGAVGVWSCYRTYSKRYELRIRIEDRHKPLSMYPVEPKECHRTLSDAVGLDERRGMD